MNFEEELKAFLSAFEQYFRYYFSKRLKFVSKYASLIGRFYQDLFDFASGGKKLRAFLVYLGYKIASSKSAGWRIKKVLPISLAYELIHSFLLIHDDIIDQSDTRRGKSTIHKRYEKFFGSHYGISQAIVLGDIACSEAFDLINSSQFTQSQKLLCQKQLIATILETCYGEGLDVEYSYRSASLEEIWQMTEFKTAKYTFVGPLTVGATLGGVDKKQLDYLAKFGLLLGKAFQFQDDILGVFGKEKVLGKSILSDMREGKNTVLIFKARQIAESRDRKELNKIWGKRNAKMTDLLKVRKIIEEIGVFEWCQSEKERLVKRAKAYISKITDDQGLRNILSQMADFVIKRES